MARRSIDQGVQLALLSSTGADLDCSCADADADAEVRRRERIDIGNNIFAIDPRIYERNGGTEYDKCDQVPTVRAVKNRSVQKIQAYERN